MAKQVPVEYIHSIPPENFKDWPRYIDLELFLIEQALNTSPTAMAIRGNGSIGVTTTPTTITLGIGAEPDFDFPGGNYNSLTGEWTAPQNGLYSFSLSAELDAFGSGNKTYFAKLEVFKNGISALDSTDGGMDSTPLGVIVAGPAIVLQGDVFRAELSTQHEQFTGNTNYKYSLSVIRQSAT